MSKQEKADQHLAWQQRVGWEDRAKKNFDSQNPDMMFATGANWDRRGKSYGPRKPAQSMVRYRKTWERPGEPEIKAELVYSPLKCAWVYREPSTMVNQEYHHPDFNNISKFSQTQTFFPRINSDSQQQLRKPRHLRGKSYAGALRRKLDESIERTSELEDKVSYMRMKLSQRLTSPQYGQSAMSKQQSEYNGPTFYQVAPKCTVRPVIDAQGKYYNFVY